MAHAATTWLIGLSSAFGKSPLSVDARPPNAAWDATCLLADLEVLAT
jgi:hypothetical protein